MVKIVAVEAIPFQVPYRRPLHFASGSVTRADHVLVQVHTDEGLVGVAEAPPRPYTYGESQASIVAAVNQWFAPALIGTDPLAREQFHARTAWVIGNHTARGALDIALWDLQGQISGQPTHALLGGFAQEMDVSYMIGFDTPSAMVDDAVEIRERYGVQAFKVKVGRSLAVDLAACTALREALGPDALLYVDGNRGWTADETLRALRRLVELDIVMIEEPCPVTELIGRARVVEQSPIPIVGDESCTRVHEVARNLTERLCTSISVKVARTGFSESQRILGVCAGLGAPVLMGNQVDGAIGTLASVTFGAAHEQTTRLPGELVNFVAMADDLLAEPLTVANGRLAPRQQPGIGALIDAGKLAHYRTDSPDRAYSIATMTTAQA